MTVTTKQADYIATLIDREIAKYRTTDRRKAAAVVALALAIPAPTTAAEASAQIDDLKGGVMAYWQTRKSDAALVLAKVAAAFGKDAANAPATNDPAYLDLIRAAIA